MYEDSLKQLNMCTVACLNDSHLPSDTHTFHCACQSAQAQKKRKKKSMVFFSLLLLLPFWVFVGQVTSLLPLPHLLRWLLCWDSASSRKEPGQVQHFWKVPTWRVVDTQRGAVVLGLLWGRVDGNITFKKQYTKIIASYRSDLLRPKLQATEIFFFPSLVIPVWWQVLQHQCLSEHKPCLWHEGLIFPNLACGRKRNERQVLPLPPVRYSLPSHHLLSGKKEIFFKVGVEERQIENGSTFGPTPPSTEKCNEKKHAQSYLNC